VSEYLDSHAVAGALVYLDTRWTDRIHPRQIEEWENMLGQLKVHELRPALCMLPPEKRPTPDEVLAQVKELREIFKDAPPEPPPSVVPKTTSRPALPRELAKPDVVNPIIEQARASLTGRNRDQEAG
jgi:hypothetical protein